MANSTPVIREARREDVPDIVALLADDDLGRHREDPSLPLAAEYLAAFEDIDRDPRTELLVLELDGRVVGTLHLHFLPSLSRRGATRATVEAVRIARDMRGQGLGHQLMRAASERARARGCRVVQLTTDLQREDAHRFYRSLGFVHSHAGMKLEIHHERD